MNELRLLPSDDEIEYRVTAVKVLRRRTVRVSVPVELLVGPDEGEAAAIDAKVREALARVLPAEWATSSVERQGDAAGYERLALTAWTRIGVEQAINLSERARAVRIKGLSIGEPELDYRAPASTIAAASGDLRRDIVEQVKSQIAEFDAWTGRSWRIGNIAFGVSGARGQRTSKGAYRSDDDVEERDGVELERLGGVERLQLVAEVVLRASPPSSDRLTDAPVRMDAGALRAEGAVLADGGA